MNCPNPATEKITLFRKFSNVTVVLPKGPHLLARYLGEDNAYVYLVRLGYVENGVATFHKDPDTMKYRMKFPIEVMRNLRDRELAWRVDECGIPKGMSKFSLADKEDKEALREKNDVVSHIVRVYGDSPFKDKKTYSEAVANAARKFGFTEKSVRKYYEHFLFYGGHEFAQAPRDWDKGGEGVERLGARRADGTLIESGRKTFAEVIDPSTHLSRMQFPVYLFERLKKYVRREAHVPGATITDIARGFLRSQVGHNRDADGKKQTFAVDPRTLPSERNTIRKVTPIFHEEKAKLALLRSSARGRGYSAQIANGDLNVVDIDGTVADCFIRFGDSIVGIDSVLKPTVLLAIDRSSRAIIGWYVTYRPEDANSYLACVFSACTDKEDELARWRVSHLDGMVYGCPSAIFVDRGPGISEKVHRAIVSGMRQRLLMAEPGKPQAKGDVEQTMDFFQEEVADIIGSTHGEPVKGKGPEKDAARKRNREKLRKAVASAKLTLEQFMRALLTAISRHNLNSDMRRARTRLMAEAEVPPVPKHMFLFNVAMRAGDAAWDLTEEAIIRRLAKPFSPDMTAPSGIVSFDKREFTCDELRIRAIEHEATHNGSSMPIKGYELFTSKLHALWDDDGYLVELGPSEQTLEKFGIAIPDLRDYIQMRDLADLEKQRDKNRLHPTVEQAVKRGGVSQATQRRMEATEGLPPTVNNRRARKTAEAHASAAHTRAVLASAQKTSALDSNARVPAVAEPPTRSGSRRVIDINF
ncbi:integrase-like protein [Paraburkholderia sp. BL23I1N1]|uniref:DDE-type integrase/transposase/recombinase n=1 Tax=Paraburkholderia sp. BL23I1N1 TaxID=1938802 RepID=UPI000E723CFC|nr:DDE-type integrase/transposase/recombinase [Paraburkholderia sp. BL23I1N1]RKE25180.1 integrase-like protein [Paraburkholderia sp. BL23I1N1]